MLGAILRGRVGRHPWTDDWQNFWNLTLDREAARAFCPLCGYEGPFLTFAGRPRQVCLGCGSRARHRVLALALERRRPQIGFDVGLHLAPEPCLRALLGGLGRKLFTGDLDPGVGETALDLRRLPFDDESLDFVFSSHVLEHIVEDREALAEIYRVLRPGGLAITMVPITAERTHEFGKIDPGQNFHARECGPDYFERYGEAGFEVEVVRSDQLGEPERCALVTMAGGEPTLHYVPFCRKPGDEISAGGLAADRGGTT